MARKSSGRGQRDLRVKVKSARGRKLSSTRWLERQLNDPYVRRAKDEGYRGRAAFKILELDDKYRFLVMDRYGKDLQAIFQSGKKLFSDKVAFNLAIKIVRT